MSESNLSDKELLKSILEPLLDDFQYWLDRSHTLLENEKISFLGDQEQNNLLWRVNQAQQEVSTARMLFQATGCEVGIEMATLMPWHKLLNECRLIAMRYRAEQTTDNI